MMLEAINQIIQHHPEYAMAVAFVFALVESLPFIGSLFPGMLTMPPIGWLMATGKIPCIQTAAIIFAGGMFGDMIGFYLGCFSQQYILKQAKRYDKTAWLSVGEAFVERYGPMSIIIGRFFGPFRSSVPLFAGLFKMRIDAFIFAAIPSVILWAIVHLSPGIMIAWFDIDLFSLHQQLGIQLLLMLVLLVAIPVSQCVLKDSHFEKMTLRLHISAAVCHKLIGIVVTLLAMGYAFMMVRSGSFDWVNQEVYQYFGHQNLWLLRFALIQSSLCYIPFMCLLAVVLFLCNQQDEHAALILLSVGLSFLLCFILKHLIHYPRPDHIAGLLGNQSLPSGHSCIATTLILALMDKKTAQVQKYWGYLFIFCTILSRLIIGAHWLSDVVVGWILGYFAFLFSKIVMSNGKIVDNIVSTPIFRTTNRLIPNTTQRGIVVIYCAVSLTYALITHRLAVSPYLL